MKKVIFLVCVLTLLVLVLVGCSEKVSVTTVAPGTTASLTTEKPLVTDPTVTTVGNVTTSVVTTAPIVTTAAPVVTMGPVTMSNPNSTILDTDWYDYGCGDPFVMRFNGVYYLYCSTRDGERGIYCWSSKDMANWKFEGKCATEAVTAGAYAPEVYYADGMFYMYSSPQGNGHYVFSSESPTGPFKKVTGNFGLSIDGSVFIDDNGQWYFYRADGSGIIVHRMSSPTHVSPDGTNTGANMRGWTEGSMLIKHDGVYFLTYTGNHVLNNAYRIDYAYSTNSCTSFTMDNSNPLLISTENGVKGIGHSSTVKGPDLDTYYIVYHVLIGRANMGAPSREAYFDKIVFNGTTMRVLGPTTAEQTICQADIFTHFDELYNPAAWVLNGGEVSGGYLNMAKNGSFLSQKVLGDTYTAEFNLLSPDSAGQYGAYFSYTDENNYGKICFDLSSKNIKITLVTNGVSEEKTCAMPKNCSKRILTTALQSFQVERSNGVFSFYFNDRPLCEIESKLGGGKIGYYTTDCTAKFGYIGASEKVGGDVDGEDEKPIPGVLDSLSTLEAVEKSKIDSDNRGYEYVNGAKKGDKLTYVVNASKAGKYDFGIYYKASSAVRIKLYYNGVQLDSVVSLGATGADFATVVVRGIEIPSTGRGELTLEVESGSLSYKKITLDEHTDVTELAVDYESSSKEAKLVRYKDGTWIVQSGVLSLSSDFGKRTYGETGWGDYIVEADVTCTSGVNSGIIFRVNNPGTGGHFDSVNLSQGTDWIQGYFAGVSAGGVVLGKQNYSWQEVGKKNMTMVENKTYHLKVVANGANFKIYLDGELVIDYTDPDPYLTGAVGFRVHSSKANFDNLVIKPLEE